MYTLICMFAEQNKKKNVLFMFCFVGIDSVFTAIRCFKLLLIEAYLLDVYSVESVGLIVATTFTAKG